MVNRNFKRKKKICSDAQRVKRMGVEDLARYYVIDVHPEQKAVLGDLVLMKIASGKSNRFTRAADRSDPNKKTTSSQRKSAKFMLRRENLAYAHLQLNHPAFLQAFPQVGKDSVLVTEFRPGISLRSYVNNNIERALVTGGKAMFEYIRDVLTTSIAAAQGVEYFQEIPNEGSLVYRNIRPEKIFICGRTKQGRTILKRHIKLEDLSRSCTEGPIDPRLNSKGYSEYDAPETIGRNAFAVPKSDVYSLGIVLRESLGLRNISMNDLLQGAVPKFNLFPSTVFAYDFTRDMTDTNPRNRPTMAETVFELDDIRNMHLADAPKYL
ncbi:MAG: protein kinase [Nanoarchaeota archaeon]|nr:protein kinase [Nanoarchaeota archaeon]